MTAERMVALLCSFKLYFLVQVNVGALSVLCPRALLPLLSSYIRIFLASIFQLHVDLPPDITFIASSWLSSVLGRRVYLHCSSIFSGANTHVRKVKKIPQLLEKHKVFIIIFTQGFTLSAVAAIAKELLEEQIFEFLPRAKLRYPELFQPSETQEAERAASEAEVIRIEAEAAQDIVLTSDGEGEDELDSGQSPTVPLP